MNKQPKLQRKPLRTLTPDQLDEVKGGGDKPKGIVIRGGSGDDEIKVGS